MSWHPDAAKFVALLQARGERLRKMPRAKYLELRIDTRDGSFRLSDRDGQPLTLEEVMAALS